MPANWALRCSRAVAAFLAANRPASRSPSPCAQACEARRPDGASRPLVLAKPIAEQWFNKAADRERWTALDAWFRRLASPASPAAGLVAILLALAGSVAVYSNKLHPREKFAPQAALHALQTNGIGGNGLNSYDFGGFLSSRVCDVHRRSRRCFRRPLPTFVRDFVEPECAGRLGAVARAAQHSVDVAVAGNTSARGSRPAAGLAAASRQIRSPWCTSNSCPTSRSAPAPSQQPCMGGTVRPGSEHDIHSLSLL